ncbi:MAG: PHP domain-containing protein [Halanaerobiales bacterium]
MDNDILNPYAEKKDIWLKGNLHTHTLNTDGGDLEVGKVIELYLDHNYDFISITDYDRITEVSDDYKDLVILKGYESTKNSHILCIAAEDVINGSPGEIIDNVNNYNGISVLCHPNWKRWDYWSAEEMEVLERYTGIEIYNSVINRMIGSSEAFDEWDYLLSIGKRVWGFANDDFYKAKDVNKAWNVVRVNNKDEKSIIQSIREGNFYTSTGVDIYDIYMEKDKIIVESDADKLRFISCGRILSEVLSSKAVFDINDFNGYLRVEAIKEDGSRAWSQPVFKVE